MLVHKRQKHLKKEIVLCRYVNNGETLILHGFEHDYLVKFNYKMEG